MASERPNIQLLFSDQRRADAMGCAVDPVIQTPNLDRLAAEGVTALQHLRYVCDDLKAFYREAYLAQYPDAAGARIEAWFWHETAMGDLIRRVRDRVKASDDPCAQAIAFGISRV